jgi:putative IMPACT (imprinted ancient) family translation regulator
MRIAVSPAANFNNIPTVVSMSAGERQEEEYEILVSIYGEGAVSRRYDTNMMLLLDIIICPGVILRATLAPSYPTDSSPQIELIGRDIPEPFKEVAYKHFHHYLQENSGEVVLFDCVEWIKEHIQLPFEQRQQQRNEEVSHQVTSVSAEQIKALTRAEESSVHERFDEIYHGETLIDRKSVFQAHVAPIHSAEEAMNILAILKTDRKISRATHNMFAYRITLPSAHPSGSGEPIHIADNDDDGEDAAGPKLAQLLSLMNAENLIVVVSRWYGGIQLGPDRFRHIANVARRAIEDSGVGLTAIGKGTLAGASAEKGTAKTNQKKKR